MAINESQIHSAVWIMRVWQPHDTMRNTLTREWWAFLYTSLWQHLQKSSTLGPQRWAPCSFFIFYFVCAINLLSHSNKNKMSIDNPFFSSIMQFGKLFDHGMFLFLIKRCFKLIYKNILFKVSLTSTHHLEIIWH